MPYLPAGCFLHLEKQAKEHVLQNIRSATANLRGERLLSELRQLCREIEGEISLQQIIDCLNLDSPDEIYRRGLPHQLLAEAEGKPQNAVELNDQLSKGFRRIALMDDTHLIEDARRLVTTGTSDSDFTQILLHSLLWGTNKPGEGTLYHAQRFITSHQGVARDLTELLDWLLKTRTPLQNKVFEQQTGPLNLHASYTREQITHALRLGSFESPISSREGILHVPGRKLDLFFADINKSEADFSPTTMYEDYAITDSLFHWQSQSQTSDSSAVGRRLIEHQAKGYTPILFIRDRKRLSNGLTSPYFFAGPLRYHKHEGSKPITIIWELEHTLPARALSWARRVG